MRRLRLSAVVVWTAYNVYTAHHRLRCISGYLTPLYLDYVEKRNPDEV